MSLMLWVMSLVLLIPLYSAWRGEDIWPKMLAFASLSTKTSILILMISVLRDDWMIGLVGVLILTLGNSALMLLAHLLKEINQSC